MSASPFFNEDHESIREMARDFADRTLSPIAAEVDRSIALDASALSSVEVPTSSVSRPSKPLVPLSPLMAV